MGLEVGDQIVVVGGHTEDEKPQPDQEVDVEDQIVEVAAITAEEEESEVEVETLVDFVCPDAGFYPSQTNCAQYYQCTAEKKVITNYHFYLFGNLHYN